MARQLLLKQIPLSSSGLGLPAVTLLLCAFALFMCASHSRKWRRWSACYGPSDHDPVIQLNTVDTMLGTGEHGIHAGSRDDSMFSGEQKCQLPDFSGVIIYDSDGNVVTPAKNPRPLLLTWK
ncbi:hypothetical protein NC652_014478 [Populus alba x Populus x berolinensis]|nr:hypothetical protein NC652_014478 [Populus alba x Populus x berolinensis]